MFDFISAQHQEWATLINWCRNNGSGAVAIGGSSLGAQSAKAIAMNASDWPDRLKPDALLIITHSQHMAEAAQDGVLSDIWNLGSVEESVDIISKRRPSKGSTDISDKNTTEKLRPDSPPRSA